jgi:hypothetical protein
MYCTMLNIPESAIRELKGIYITEFNTLLTDEQAQAEARRLLLFYYEFLLYLQDTKFESKGEEDTKQKKIINKKKPIHKIEPGKLHFLISSYSLRSIASKN